LNTHKLDCLFKPRRIALIGVSTNPNSVSGKVLQNLVGGGFDGVVYPVNPDREAVLGIQCYPAVERLPRVPDLAVICSPAEQVPEQVERCGQAGVRGVIVISAGFRETGAAGRELEEQLRQVKRRYETMRLLGPNCLGIIVPGAKLNISFATGLPKAGRIAFISQSGALCTSVLDWALEDKIGFSYFVSIGNALDVGFGDLIDYFGDDETTESILLYIESIYNARRFMTAARAFARSKPILAYKAGRFPESARVAASHTGALASEDAVYDAAFHRIGISRVDDIGEIFDCAELIGRSKMPQGARLGIITNAGGPGVMASDTLIAMNGTLPRLAEQTIAELDANLPPFWSHANPVDVLGDARAKRIAKATQIVLNDPNIDAVLVILTPQAMTNPTATAREIAKLAETNAKPILAAWLGGQTMREGIRILTDAGVATYMTPEQAIRAFMKMVERTRNLAMLYETPRDLAVQFNLDRAALHDEFIAGAAKLAPALPEILCKQLLAGYGIPTARPLPAATPEEAVRLARSIGYPVVLKINSPAISHKTDVGGVILNIDDDNRVAAAFEQILHNVKINRPDAPINGITVQPMIGAANAVEMILGIKQDAVFGTVILAGMGGVEAELFGDRTIGFPPLNERLARLMLEGLTIWPLLNGYRGRPPVNLAKLLEIMIRLSYLAADFPEITELDINPLLVTPAAVIALDARILIDPAIRRNAADPYHHLALKPYPEKYIRRLP